LFENGEINNIKDVLYMFSINNNLLFAEKIIDKGH